MGELDMEPDTIRVYPSPSDLPRIIVKTLGNLKTRSPRIVSSWRYLNDLPVDQLGLAFHLV
jgi:hypothetical protein